MKLFEVFDDFDLKRTNDDKMDSMYKSYKVNVSRLRRIVDTGHVRDPAAILTLNPKDLVTAPWVYRAHIPHDSPKFKHAVRAQKNLQSIVDKVCNTDVADVPDDQVQSLRTIIITIANTLTNALKEIIRRNGGQFFEWIGPDEISMDQVNTEHLGYSYDGDQVRVYKDKKFLSVVGDMKYILDKSDKLRHLMWDIEDRYRKGNEK